MLLGCRVPVLPLALQQNREKLEKIKNVRNVIVLVLLFVDMTYDDTLLTRKYQLILSLIYEMPKNIIINILFTKVRFGKSQCDLIWSRHQKTINYLFTLKYFWFGHNKLNQAIVLNGSILLKTSLDMSFLHQNPLSGYIPLLDKGLSATLMQLLPPSLRRSSLHPPLRFPIRGFHSRILINQLWL